ncbi:MAG: sugar phosphate isomerase/epimerase [Spirochaetes bacterium]|nr:sugar phosphate isomerase/epimerase [Spirochaetota bacterium]
MEGRYSVCNELFGSLPLEEACDLVAGEGFQGVEFAPFTLFESFSPSNIEKGLRSLRKALSQSGLSFVGFHWLFLKPEGLRLLTENLKEREKAWEHLNLLIEVAGELGGGVLVLGSPAQRAAGTTPKERANEYFREGLARAAEQAHRNRSVLLLEALPSSATDMVNTLQEVYDWVMTIRHPGLSGMFDFHNTGDETEAWDVLVSKYSPILQHVHFNSRDGSWPLPEKEGKDSEYHSAFQGLKKNKYKGWISLEIFTVPENPRGVLQDTRAFLRKVWEE